MTHQRGCEAEARRDYEDDRYMIMKTHVIVRLLSVYLGVQMFVENVSALPPLPTKALSSITGCWPRLSRKAATLSWILTARKTG